MICSLKMGQVPNNDKMFNIVVPTYEGATKLEVFINCFLSQSCDDWHLTIVSDGPEPETLEQLQKYKDCHQISYYQTDKRCNDWGHTPREFGMLQSDCEFTIMTGFDNYYVPLFIEIFKNAYIEKHAENIDMMFCNFVLDHPREGIKYNGFIDSSPDVNFIDIGSFALRTEILKVVGFKFRSYAADAELVEAAKNYININNRAILKIPQTLYVHN